MIKDKLYNFTYKAVAVLYLVFWAFIIFCNFFLSQIGDFRNSSTSAIANFPLLLIGCGIVSLLYIGVKKVNTDALKISVATFILFFFQVYIFSNILFRTETWDAEIIRYNASLIANGESRWLNNAYFSWYPNNQGILLLEALLLTINNKIGILGTDNGLILIILIQCTLSSYAGKCLYDVIARMLKSEKMAWLGWLLYVLLIGLSGWNVVAYTDIMSIVFPILILKVYSSKNLSCYKKWPLILTLTYCGFKIKPTVAIVAIAVVVVELIYQIGKWTKANIRETLKKALSIVCICGVLLALYSATFSLAVKKSGLYIDKEADTGPLHMVMMGLNPENHGLWYSADVELSQSISNREERTETQKDIICQRLKDYGVSGLLNHLEHKTIACFNDGTFSWGGEGGFYDIVYPDKNQIVSPILKSIYYNSGSNYIYYFLAMQILWMVVLFGSTGVLLAPKCKENMALILSLIGIILFVTIFEARARYILIYVPFFIIASLYTVKVIEEKIRKRKIIKGQEA